MAVQEECKGFFALPDDPMRGDWIFRCKDERCEYWMAVPGEAPDDPDWMPQTVRDLRPPLDL